LIYLVRHAKAGDRGSWDGNDRLRPLTPAGLLQAVALLDVLEGARFTRIVSSPYVRCLETVVPLAGRHYVPIEPHDALAEGAVLDEVLKLIEECAPTGAVLCSHGDVIPDLIGHFAAASAIDVGDPHRCAKGSTWVVDIDAIGTVTAATYLPAP
jgi:8-oxo-dGTP diphosphatase